MMPNVVLLTGLIGSGKTTVRKMFEALGVPCIDADAICKRIQSTKGHPCINELHLLFPGSITFNDTDMYGVLNRSWMRELVARDQYANKLLVKVMTPYVMTELQTWIDSHADTVPYVIYESALISNGTDSTHHTLLVSASRDNQIARVRLRNPDWTDAEIVGLLNMQPRKSCADSIIFNDGSQEDLQQEVLDMHTAYTQLWSNP